MDTLVNLLKDHRIGIWCKRAAWITLVIGLIEIIFSVIQQLNSVQDLITGDRIQALIFGLAGIPSVLFYFFILYAAGAMVNRFVGSQNVANKAGEDQDDVLEEE